MESANVVSYREEFYPLGLRKTLAIALVVAVTVLPEAFSWLGTPTAKPAISRGLPTGQFRPRGGYFDQREEPRVNVLGLVWSFMKRSFIVVVATLGVMMYYPRPGFKRYALLCGPLMAFLTPLCVRTYLQGRTEVFRAEILVVSLIALMPGIALYVFLTGRKAKRVGMVW